MDDFSESTSRSRHVGAPLEPGRTSAVLDTHVVLDWLVFCDPRVDLLAQRILTGRLHWLCSAAMRDELAHVLARGGMARWNPDADALFAAWDRHAQLRRAPPPAGEAARLQCRDPDDQKFIDLALACGAQWLLTRDRALLALAGRARAFGLQVVTPESWRAGQGA